jgi:hypothetical protein
MADIGAMLGGFSAGIQGRLPEFQQTQIMKQQQEQQQQELAAQKEAKRQETFFIDAYAAKNLLEKGNIQGVINLGKQRINYLGKMGVDSSDTARLTNLAIAVQSGDPQAISLLRNELDAAIETGTAYGILKQPERPTEKVLSNSDVINGQVVTYGPQGARATPVENFSPAQQARGQIVSGQSATAMGLDPQMQYYIDAETGKPSVLSGGGTTINMPGSGPSKMGSEGIEKRFLSMLDAAGSAAQVAPVLESLKQLTSETTEGRAGQLLTYLFPGSEFADANMAYSSLVSQILPSLRSPGSGAQSDRDIESLMKGMGKIESSREVKLLALEAMSSKISLNQALADVAEKFFAGEMSMKETLAATRKLEGTTILSPKLKALLGELAPVRQIPKTALDAGMTQEEFNTLTPKEQGAWL